MKHNLGRVNHMLATDELEIVGLSNMLDSESSEDCLGGASAGRTHQETARAGFMNSELLTIVGEGVEAADAVETLLVLPAAAFELAVVPWGEGPDKLVAYA